jgi:pimeloyl-ACP methyl ester carboxylesterase
MLHLFHHTMHVLTLCLSVFFSLAASAQTALNFSESAVELTTATGTIKGTLLLPTVKKSMPVALIIAGSGPTDRDGNNPMIKNNHLKMLAEGLATRGIACVRYDKRGIAQSQGAAPEEKDLRFEHYINDAAGWITLLKTDKRFSKVIVLGHSEGSLIGMLAVQHAKADAFVSLAGAGRRADQLIRQQLQTQPQQVKDQTFPILDTLVMGKTVDTVNPAFAALFRPSVQPYLISWFRYDPQKEIKKLSVPVLIVQGKNDLQVSESEAMLLAEAAPEKKLVFIDKMNHILKESPPDMQANAATYSNPTLPVIQLCIETIYRFTTSVQ